MKRILLPVLLSLNYITFAQSLITPFEQSNGKQSATYEQAISFYNQLDDKYDQIEMQVVGPTDAGRPLHVVYYTNDGDFNITDWKQAGKMVLLINNGIHPGEPDGIDASMMLLRDAAERKIKVPDNVVLAVIPVFNIGGALNRNSYSRANQNGPEAYGFRGNSQNLDLNRDFVKMDAKETRSLVKLWHKIDPDFFIDNHVSDGADYQHIMTLLATQHDKLGGSMGRYLNEKLEPMIYEDMKQKGYDLVPYVNDFQNTPDSGWTAFYERPRFASGYAVLFQTYSFVPETHMLKPFNQRVIATYKLMESFIKIASEHSNEIHATRQEDRKAIANQNKFTLEWKEDMTKPTFITFKGYQSGYKTSEVSNLPRLYYDRNKPFSHQIPFYNTFVPAESVDAPIAYAIPQAWGRIINRLKDNGVNMKRLDKDSDLAVQSYYVTDYETVKKPYEGHYLHSKVGVVKKDQTVHLLKGDYIIPVNQLAKRYIIEALEPTAPDAFFAWGFFDAVLQQKEYYSDYVFEDESADYLRSHPELRQTLDTKKKTDTAFTNSAEMQLDFVYRHSPYYEPEHMRYPVFRIEH